MTASSTTSRCSTARTTAASCASQSRSSQTSSSPTTPSKKEGFARALKERRSYRAEGPFEGWLWRVVVHAALDARRNRHPRDTPSELVGDPAATNGHASDENGVRRWIAALPDRQRLAVYLRYYADLDYRGIARVLEIEVGTVSATLAPTTHFRRMSPMPRRCNARRRPGTRLERRGLRRVENGRTAPRRSPCRKPRCAWADARRSAPDRGADRAVARGAKARSFGS